MSEVAGIVLNSILKNPEELLDIWPKLKLQYFNSSYSEIFIAITKYYNKFNEIPNFQALEITVRNQALRKKVKALALLDVDADIDIEIAVEALIDQYTQDELLDSLYKYVDKITYYDSRESILKLSDIVMHIEEMVDHSEEVYLQSDLFLLDEEELLTKIPFTLNNSLDAITGGIELTNLVMIGGHRGSGKTVAGCNLACNHYNNGGVTVFFTIEMRAREINWRMMSILSGVSNKNIKNQILTSEETIAIAKTRAGFFVDSEEVYQDYLEHKDYNLFEKDLVTSKILKPDNQIIIVDNSTLTLADIDANLQKLKAKHGDNLKSAVVDSMNKIVTADKYDWKNQINTADKIKDFGDKHNLLMVSSYQTDAGGEARFAKGILDSPDYAINLTNMGSYLHFESTKTRGTSKIDFNAEVNWDTLKISQEDYIVPEDDANDEEPTEKAKEDIAPWK